MGSRQPRLLDLFCGAGGAAMGYHRAGFEVVGVDIMPQPRYPFHFIQADALTFPLASFDAIHASPVCKGLTRARHKVSKGRRVYPVQIDAMRRRLQGLQVPWVIENVEDANRLMPDGVMLCGSMFGLGIKRHRLFTSSILLFAPQPCGSHAGVYTIFGHDTKRVVAGKRIGGGVQLARRLMGIDWMTQEELSESIPPAYTEWIGRQLILALADAA